MTAIAAIASANNLASRNIDKGPVNTVGGTPPLSRQDSAKQIAATKTVANAPITTMRLQTGGSSLISVGIRRIRLETACHITPLFY